MCNDKLDSMTEYDSFRGTRKISRVSKNGCCTCHLLLGNKKPHFYPKIDHIEPFLPLDLRK